MIIRTTTSPSVTDPPLLSMTLLSNWIYKTTVSGLLSLHTNMARHSTIISSWPLAYVAGDGQNTDYSLTPACYNRLAMQCSSQLGLNQPTHVTPGSIKSSAHSVDNTVLASMCENALCKGQMYSFGRTSHETLEFVPVDAFLMFTAIMSPAYSLTHFYCVPPTRS